MSPLRVAMLSHTYPTFAGGFAAAFVHHLAVALIRRGHEVYAVVPWHPSMRSHETMDGVHLVTFRPNRLISYGDPDTYSDDSYIRRPRLSIALSMLDSVLRLYRAIREFKIDIVHAHWTVPMGFVAGFVKILTGIPVFVTMHGRDIRPTSAVTRLWFMRPFLRFAFSQADRLIVVSQEYAGYARAAGAPPDKIHIIGNGVDLERFCPSQQGVDQVRRRYAIPDCARVILAVGELSPHKGFDLLLKAMPTILEQVPETVALIVGAGQQLGTLVALCDQLGVENRVIFVGEVPNAELGPYENACDLLVMPSRAESFGIAALEAMACARPVVAACVGGLAGIVVDGETGLHVPPDDSASLARAIIHLLQDQKLAQAMGMNALQRVRSSYSWDHVAQETDSLYMQVLR